MVVPRLVAAALVMLIPLAGGCGLFGSKEPVPIEVTVTASDRLNPDEQGQSLPTVVRILQLKGSARLEGADFDPVYRRLKEALGEDLLAMEELTLSPGQSVRRQLDRDPAARAIAVVGLFRRPSALSWRALADLPPPGKRAAMAFAVEGYRIERR
jgi:type VI secretion system protein VasD